MGSKSGSASGEHVESPAGSGSDQSRRSWPPQGDREPVMTGAGSSWGEPQSDARARHRARGESIDDAACKRPKA